MASENLTRSQIRLVTIVLVMIAVEPEDPDEAVLAGAALSESTLFSMA